MYRYIQSAADTHTWIYPQGSPLWVHGRYIGDTDRDVATTASSKEHACNNIRHKLKEFYNLSAHPKIDSSKLNVKAPPAARTTKPTTLPVDDQIKIDM